jgi:hypothetical protein
MADEVESQAINEEGTGVKQSQKAEINLPLSLPKEQSGEKEEAPAKTTSTLDENSKQPKSMEDVYKESETRKIPPSPTRICRECLEEAYGGYEDKLRAISQDYFKPVFNNLKELDRFDGIISQLILYCEKDHHRFECLWEIIKKDSPGNYKKYYQQWQKAVESMEATDYRYEPVPDSSENSRRVNPGDEPHPLATGNNDTVNKWFFDELNRQDQSFVLTVALFEGANRKLLSELNHKIESLLFGAE